MSKANSYVSSKTCTTDAECHTFFSATTTAEKAIVCCQYFKIDSSTDTDTGAALQLTALGKVGYPNTTGSSIKNCTPNYPFFHAQSDKTTGSQTVDGLTTTQYCAGAKCLTAGAAIAATAIYTSVL